MNEKIYEKPEEVKNKANDEEQKIANVDYDELIGEIRTDDEPYPERVLPKWLYDLLCFIARFFLPACGAAYGALAAIWNFPYGEAIVSSTSVLSIFLSTILMIDSKKYFNKGVQNGEEH